MTLYTWCPSTFIDLVVHVREHEGDETAPCGQGINPSKPSRSYSIECPECWLWEARQHAQWLVKRRRSRKPPVRRPRLPQAG